MKLTARHTKRIAVCEWVCVGLTLALTSQLCVILSVCILPGRWTLPQVLIISSLRLHGGGGWRCTGWMSGGGALLLLVNYHQVAAGRWRKFTPDFAAAGVIEWGRASATTPIDSRLLPKSCLGKYTAAVRDAEDGFIIYLGAVSLVSNFDCNNNPRVNYFYCFILITIKLLSQANNNP